MWNIFGETETSPVPHEKLNLNTCESVLDYLNRRMQGKAEKSSRKKFQIF